MPGTLWVSDARPEGEARRRAWRRGGRWRIWDPPGGPNAPVTDVRHQNQDETDLIMAQIGEEIREGVSEEPGGRREPGRPGVDAADGADEASAARAVEPDLQDAVTVAILARELAAE